MNNQQPNAPIKLIALDMDGTVLLEDKTISPRVHAAITAAVAKGVMIIPATGRAAQGVPAAFLEVAKPRYAITANGARVVDLQTGETMQESLIPTDLALAAYDALQKYDCMLDLFQHGKGYSCPKSARLRERLLPENLRDYVRRTRTEVPNLRDFVETQADGVEKWTMFFADETARMAAWNEMNALGFEAVSSLPRNMELNAPGVSKGSALAQLAQIIHLPLAQVMACGDGGNDLEMVKTAGFGVAMANGTADVKAVAQYITDTNENDGVALAIEQFVL